MHYIVGTQITISGKTIEKIRPGMTSQQIRESSAGRTQFKAERNKFTSNRAYTLIRIHKISDPEHPNGGNIAYVWSDGTGERISVEFNSVARAEEFISEIKGETVPEYNTVYDRTD